MKITITSPLKMRYATSGDWRGGLGDLKIEAVEMEDDDHVFLIAIHELVEAYLCIKAGITAAQVDEFDFAYEGDGESGMSRMRRIATNILRPRRSRE